MSDTLHSGPGWVENGDRILLDRHDYREWVEWTPGKPLPPGARVRHEYVYGSDAAARLYVHPDDVPTDPDAGLVERVAKALFDRDAASVGAPAKNFGMPIVRDAYVESARIALAMVRDHDKADR
jgi:hypothetical protein